jgi:hypothetical protein
MTKPKRPKLRANLTAANRRRLAKEERPERGYRMIYDDRVERLAVSLLPPER